MEIMKPGRTISNEASEPNIRDVSIDDLLPIQAKGVSEEHLLRLSQVSVALPPPTVVPLPIDNNERQKYLLIDGTHTTKIFHDKGVRSIKVIVLDSDDAVEKSRSISLIGCKSVSDVIKRYKEVWKIHLDKAGVVGVDSLKIHTENK